MLHQNQRNNYNCFSIIAGKNATTTGNVIVAHNEDDAIHCKTYRGYVPAKDWPEGSIIPAEIDHAIIPQVKQTHGYFWTEVKAALYGLPNADGYYNDAGVLLVSNSCPVSKENLEDNSRLSEGGIEGNLRRIIIERSSNAKEALETAIKMIETYGYAADGRCYILADKDEVYIIQIVSGKHYLAVRVPDDMVVVIPNHYTLHKLDDFPETYYPNDFISYAISKGWYTPTDPNSTKDFDFIKVYADDKKMHDPFNIRRAKHTFIQLMGKEWVDSQEEMPFGCYPNHKVSPFELGNILADHYEGTEDYIELNGPGRSPHHSVVNRICIIATIDSIICEYNENPLLTKIWTCPGRPCSLPFFPHHPYAGLPKALNTMETPSSNTGVHYLPAPEKMHYIPTIWQLFRDYENKLDMLYSDVIEECRILVKDIQRETAISCKSTEETAIELQLAGKEKEAKSLLCNYDNKCILLILAALQEHENNSFNVYPSEADPIEIKPISNYVTVTFNCDSFPNEESLIFGLAGTNIRLNYASCKVNSLTKITKEKYSAIFETEAFKSDLLSPGVYDCLLGGIEENGRAFASLTMLECK